MIILKNSLIIFLNLYFKRSPVWLQFIKLLELECKNLEFNIIEEPDNIENYKGQKEMQSEYKVNNLYNRNKFNKTNYILEYIL